MEMLEAALAWCRAGFSVVPVNADKIPTVTWKEQMTTAWSEDQIVSHWSRRPEDNIAVIPGYNQFAVIDPDTYKAGGAEALSELILETGLDRQSAPRVRTPRGGEHLWFKVCQNVKSGPINDTIDIKSGQGYVVVPPSKGAAGAYVWETESVIDTDDIPDLPPAVVEMAMLGAKMPSNNHQNGETVSLGKAKDGREVIMRRAIWYAGHEMLKRGLDLSDHQKWFEIAWLRFDNVAKGRGGKSLEDDHPPSEMLRRIRNTDLDRLRRSYAERQETETAIPNREPALIQIEPWTASDNVDGNAHDFVEGLLTDRGISLWYGPSNTGKTFMVFSLAAHVAMGRQWFGREVDQGRAVYVAAEGVAGIRQRRMALKRHLGAAANDIPLDVVTTGISFLDPAGEIKALVKAIGDARLVVIDTLAAVTAGGDENTSQVMSAVIDCAKQIIAGCGAHVLIVHHQAKGNDQARGHSSLRAGVDTEIHVTSSMPGFGKCKVTKQRDLELSPAVGFQLEPVTLGVNRRGRQVTSCVAKPTELHDEMVELSRDEFVLKTIVDNITGGRDPRPITINHSGGPVRCRDHIPRHELVAHFERHAINATRSEKSIRNAFSKAWVGLSHKFGTKNGTAEGQMQLSLDSNNLGIL
ncbi:MAG: hypothetical protein CML17_02150 [Pusillimonas sp.]|nr:hypothetical protein [Pusillimonas sp.]